MTGRIGETITDAAMVRCEGCCQSLLMCQVIWSEDAEPCCSTCTHLHDLGVRLDPDDDAE